MSEIDSLQGFNFNSDFDIWQELEDHIPQYEARVKAHEKVIASSAYQNELKFIDRISIDAAMLLNFYALYYLTKMKKDSYNSLTIRSTDDLSQSIVAASVLVDEGLINPAKRELRYMIENMVKTLYVDQSAKKSESFAILTERLSFLERNVNSSIDVRENLKLVTLSPNDAKQLISDLYSIYRECCGYIHVSRKQIEERLSLVKKNRSFGFETAKELKNIGRLMFRVYDIVLALYLHNDLATTEFILTQIFNEDPKWKFHKGKYVSLVSKFFNSKHEKKNR